MKMKLFLTVMLCLVAMNLFAQIKVYNDGRMRIGHDHFEQENMIIPSLMDSTTKVRILGTEYLGANAHISFGPQYFENIKTIMLGDVYSEDHLNDNILWLHGANGFSFTQNPSATDTILSFDTFDSEFNFRYPLRAEGLLLTSDERLKDNISNVEQALEIVSALNGVTFNYAPKTSPMEGYKARNEYEQKYKDKFDRYYDNLNSERRKALHYGLVAQEVEKILPDLVHKDKNGMLSVDYIGVIPLLINAIKELKNRLEIIECEQNASGEDYNAPLVTSSLSSLMHSNKLEILSQNDPNPFTSDTCIRFQLPNGVRKGAIYIYDLQGKQIKRIDVDDTLTSVIINGGDLSAGMYIYSLIANGKELASKKMILTK